MNTKGEITVALAVILAVHLFVVTIAYKMIKEDRESNNDKNMSNNGSRLVK